MKIVSVFTGLFLICFLAHAQDGFIRTTGHLYYQDNLKIIPAPDDGWAVYEPENVTIYRYNSCGRIEWGKKYSDQPVSSFQGRDGFIATRSGGYALLKMVLSNNSSQAQLIVTDGSGNVLWSRIFSDSLFSLYSHSISQDHHGNFFVFANASRVGGNNVLMMLTKVSESGQKKWTRLYRNGEPWGTATVTTDKGCLIRSGSNYLKTDSNGQMQWGKSLPYSSDNYVPPLEVEDGYILTGVASDFSQTVAYFKLRKDGSPAFSDCKVLQPAVEGFRVAPHLRLKKDGHSGGIFNIQNRPTIVQFDGNMNVLSSHSIQTNGMMKIQGMDMEFTSDQKVVACGTVITGNSGFLPKVFAGKSDAAFQFGCDTFISVSSISQVGTVKPFTTTILLYTMPMRSDTVLVENLMDDTYHVCGPVAEPLSVHIKGDSALCSAGNPVTLAMKPTSQVDSVLWSDGSSMPTLSVSTPGKYWVSVKNNCRKEAASDTLVVKDGAFREIPWRDSLSLCQADSFLLSAEIPEALYRWQDGSSSPSVWASRPGLYSVDLSLYGCVKSLQTKIEDCEILEIPNLFTPDGNGLNERFVAGKMKGIRNLHMEIFNRWGQKIYDTNDFKTDGWDGKTSLPGFYFWFLRYTNFKGESKTKTGVVEMVSSRNR